MFHLHENVETIRKTVFDKIGHPKENKVITVITVSSEFVEIFDNFIHSPHSGETLLAVTDEDALKVSINFNFMILYYSIDEKVQELGYKPLKPFYFRTEGHRFRTAVILQTFLGGTLIKLGYNVVSFS